MSKHILAVMTAILTIWHCIPVLAVAETDTEETTEISVSSVSQPEKQESDDLGKVTVIHADETELENDTSPKWWKAELSDYVDDFSLVDYQTVANYDEAPEPEFLAEGRDDTVILVEPSDSAVQTTDPNTFAFTSYGWGHGVGMSQNGANFYAKYAGWNYQDILFHYYPGTVLKNTETAETELITVQGIAGNVLQQVSEIVNIEVGPSFHPECIKAQAVAVYTYIKYYNNDAHDLKGKPDPPQSLVDLCASVLGEALYYEDKFCLTMFCASCGGVTANCSDVFSADLPYLRSVSSEYDSQYDPHWGDVTYYTVDEVRSRIENEYHIKLSDDPRNWIQLSIGNGGYVNTVNVDGQVTVRGNSFRSVMGLKSPKFTYIFSLGQDDEILDAIEIEPETEPDSTEESDEDEIKSEKINYKKNPKEKIHNLNMTEIKPNKRLKAKITSSRIIKFNDNVAKDDDDCYTKNTKKIVNKKERKDKYFTTREIVKKKDKNDFFNDDDFFSKKSSFGSGFINPLKYLKKSFQKKQNEKFENNSESSESNEEIEEKSYRNKKDKNNNNGNKLYKINTQRKKYNNYIEKNSDNDNNSNSNEEEVD